MTLKYYNLTLTVYFRQVYTTFIQHLQQKRKSNTIRRIYHLHIHAIDNAKLGLPRVPTGRAKIKE